MTNLQIGDTAPEFSLIIEQNQMLKLNDMLGKYIILYFYPRDDTPGCTLEAKGFNSLLDEFNQVGAKIIGVSKDDLESHSKFRNKYNLQFTLGSDIKAETCSKYGVWQEKSMFGKKYMGINRSTFLISPEGKILYIWSKPSLIRHAQEVLDKLKKIYNEGN